MLKKVLGIFLVITGLYIAYNYITDVNWFGSANEDSQSTSTNNVEKIEIDLSSIEANIIPEDRSDLLAEYEGEGELFVEKNGDEIEIRVEGKPFQWFNWFKFNEREKLNIFLPEDYDQIMAIHIGSGKLEFSGSSNQPMILKELELNIGSGSVDLANLEVAKLDYDGSSGKVKGDSIKTEKSTFDISSGQLFLNGFTGEIEGEVSSGTIDIQMDELSGPIDIDVSSGKVDLDLPDNADFTLNGKTSSGKISCDFPLSYEESSKRSIQGEHGNGKHNIDLDVSSGNIHIF